MGSSVFSPDVSRADSIPLGPAQPLPVDLSGIDSIKLKPQDQVPIDLSSDASIKLAPAKAFPVTVHDPNSIPLAPPTPVGLDIHGGRFINTDIPSGGIVVPGAAQPSLPEQLKSDDQRAAEAPFAVNMRTGERYQTTPMGQNWLLDFPYTAYQHAKTGIEALAAPAEEIRQKLRAAGPSALEGSPDQGAPVPSRIALSEPNAKNAARGLSELLHAGFDAATPLMVGETLAPRMAAGALAETVAKRTLARALPGATIAAGILAAKGTTEGLKQIGVTPEYADLAGDIAGIAAGYGVHGLANWWLSPKVPPEVRALVQTTSGQQGDPAANAERIQKIMSLARDGKTPGERNAAKAALRRAYGIDLPDEVIPTEPPPPPPEAPQAEPAPTYNSAEFTKAHNLWNAATNKAATALMEENPELSFDQARQAVAGTVGVEPKIDDYKAPPPPPQPPPPPPKPEPPPKPTPVAKVSPATPNPPTAAIPTEPESPETIALQVQQLGQFGQPVQPTQRRVVMFPQGQGMPDLTTLAGLKLTHDDFGNTYAYRPDLITPGEIHRAAKNNTLPEVLGSIAGMGAPDKTALQGEPIAVTGRAPASAAATQSALENLGLAGGWHERGQFELAAGALWKAARLDPAIKDDPEFNRLQFDLKNRGINYAHKRFDDGVTQPPAEAQTTVADAASLPSAVAATHAVTPPGGTVEVKGPAAALAERQGVVPEQIPKEVIPNLTQEQVEQKSPLPESAGTPDPIREAMERARSYTEQAEAATTAAERSRLVDLSFAELDKAEALRRAASAPKKPVTPQIVSLTTPPLREPESHELTRAQYVGTGATPPSSMSRLTARQLAAQAKANGIDATAYDTKTVAGRNQLARAITHKGLVKAALGRGDAVPAQVLADYPDLLTNTYKGVENANPANLGAAQPGAVGSNPPGSPQGSVPEGNGPLPVRGSVGVRGAETGATAVEPTGGSPGIGVRGVPGETATGQPEKGVRRITGSADIPLTPGGERQVENLERKAEVVPFDAVYHAPTERSVETANQFSGTKTALPLFDGWARGVYEGEPAEKVKAEMSYLILHPDEVPAGLSPISGQPGQSWNQMALPMFDEVRLLATEAIVNHQRVLVVTSGGNMQAIDAWGKAGFPEDGNFDHTGIAAQPYWSVTGKMFKLGPDGLEEVSDDRDPGLYFIEHGETAFNSKGEPGAVTPGEKGVGSESGTEPTVQRTGPADIQPLGSQPSEVPSEPGAAEPVAGGGRGGGGTARTDVQPVPATGAGVGSGGRSSPGAVESAGAPSAEPSAGDATRPRNADTKGAGVFGSERGSFTVPKFLDKFYDNDIEPGAKWISQRLTGGFDDLRRAFAPQTRGSGARRAAGIIRERGAEMDQRRDRAFALLNGMRTHFYKQAPEHGFFGLQTWDAAETGRTMGLSGADRAFALAARALLDPRRDEMLDLGILHNYIEDYLPREWKNEQDGQSWVRSWMSKRPMAGPEKFRKQRTIPTLKEGLEDPDFTLVPKYDNPADMLMAKLWEMDQSITAHRALEELKPDGKYVPVGQKPPVGWKKIDDSSFTVYGPRQGGVSINPAKQEPKPQRSDFGLGPGRWDFPADSDDPNTWRAYLNALRDWRDTNVLPEDVTVQGQRIMGHYYFPEPIATVLNNALSQGYDGDLVKLWRGANNLTNMIQLSLSYYHGMTTTLNSSFSDMALGIEQALNGKPLEGAKSIARGFVPFASVVQDYFKGTQLQKAWDMPAEEFEELKDTDPTTWAIIDALKAAGGKGRQDQYYQTKFIDSLKAEWDKGNLAGAAWRSIPSFLELSMQPIMEYLVPRVKLSAFAKLAVEELQRNPAMTRDEQRAAFGQIWNSVDNRFGQLAQRNLLMHSFARGAMNLVMGRPGWNIGSVQEGLGGVADAARNVNDVLHGRSTRISHKTAFVLALLLGGAIINGLASLGLSGKKPEGMDFIAPRDGGVTEDGRESRIIFPTYLSKDAYSYATRPWQTIKAKAAPIISLGADLLENIDFQQHKIRNTGTGKEAIGIGPYLKQEFTPYGVAGLLQNRDRKATVTRQILPFIGIMPAGKRVGLSRAEQMLAEYQDEQRPQTTAVQTQKTKASLGVFMAARHGDMKTAKQLGSAAEADGTLTSEDVQHAIDRAKKTPLVADYKRVEDFPTAMKIYDAATPEEKSLIKTEARSKAFKAQSLPVKWKNADGSPDRETQAIVAKYFKRADGTPFRPYPIRAQQPAQ